MFEAIIALLIIFGGGTGVVALVIRNLYYICQPSEVLIFAGSSRQSPDGRRVGYRLVKGGSSVRVPLLERALRMDLTNMIIELRVSNAIERLLGKTRTEIEQIAKETLEGNLRGVLASLTPEQVNEDKLAFAKSLLEEAEDDLEQLGLVLDTLQIQNISDDVRFLDSIGRKQQADLQRDARISEAETQAESAIRTAENERITALKRLDRDIGVARAEAERRIKDALTKRGAVVAEVEAEVASELVRIQAEVPVQQERIKQVTQQLQADVVAPAEAACKRAIAQAQGNAAQIIEDGKAQAEGTQRLAESWQTAGSAARDIFLLQKLEVLLTTLSSTVPEVDVENVTVVDTTGGGSATKAAAFIEQLRHTTGIDVAGAVQSMAGTNPAPQLNPQAQLSEQDFIDLREDIQTVLDRVSEARLGNVQAERSVEVAIKTDASLQDRLKRAVQAGGEAAVDALFEHPVINIPNRIIRAWVQDD